MWSFMYLLLHFAGDMHKVVKLTELNEKYFTLCSHLKLECFNIFDPIFEDRRGTALRTRVIGLQISFHL